MLARVLWLLQKIPAPVPSFAAGRRGIRAKKEERKDRKKIWPKKRKEKIGLLQKIPTPVPRFAAGEEWVQITEKVPSYPPAKKTVFKNQRKISCT